MELQFDEKYIALRERCKHLCWQDSAKRVFTAKDLLLIDKAYQLAAKAHGNAERASGDRYISHPVAVAELLIDLGLYDRDCLMAALLHDVVEDTHYTRDDMRRMFGEGVEVKVESRKSTRLNSSH